MFKVQPTLSAMPWHIKQQIIGYTNVFTRPALRKCCREFREYVDKFAVHYKKIEIRLFKNFISVILADQDDQEMTVDYIESRHESRWMLQRQKYIKLCVRNHVERAISDIAIILKNWKSSVNRFSIPCTLYLEATKKKPTKTLEKKREAFCVNFQKQFPEFQLKAKTLSLFANFSEDELMHIIPKFYPSLEEIEFDVRGRDQNLARVTELEQWGMAMELHVKFDPHGSNLSLLNFANVYYAESVYMRISVENLELLIKEVYQTNDQLKQICIAYPNFTDKNAFFEYLGRYEELDTGHYIVGPYENNKLLVVYADDEELLIYTTDM